MNKIKIVALIVLSFVLIGCKKEQITSVEGIYKLGFNAASDGWELYLGQNGQGQLTHRTEWEYNPESTYNERTCGSFTYSVSGDEIIFMHCSLSFNYSRNNSSREVTLKKGDIIWGYTQGSKKHGNTLSISCDVLWDGYPTTEMNNVTAYQCDSKGNVYH